MKRVICWVLLHHDWMHFRGNITSTLFAKPYEAACRTCLRCGKTEIVGS